MNKIQSVNLEKTTSETSNELANWQKVLWAWQMKHLKLIKSDSSHWYDAYIIFRFSTCSQDFQLTLEQIKQLKINFKLISNKQEFLLKILMRQEEYLMWNMSELTQIHSEVTFLQKIQTISHEAWQTSSFSILKNLLKIIIKMLQSYINANMLKYCNDLYWNSWFLVKKKSEKYWIINTVINMNWYTVWGMNFLSNVEEFAERSAEMTIVLLVDFYSEYNQVELHWKSCNMIMFQTLLELLQ